MDCPRFVLRRVSRYRPGDTLQLIDQGSRHLIGVISRFGALVHQRLAPTVQHGEGLPGFGLGRNQKHRGTRGLHHHDAARHSSDPADGRQCPALVAGDLFRRLLAGERVVVQCVAPLRDCSRAGQCAADVTGGQAADCVSPASQGFTPA